MNSYRKAILRSVVIIMVLALMLGSLSACGGAVSPKNDPPAQNNAAEPSGKDNTASNSTENQVYKSSKETAALIAEADRYYNGVPGEKTDLAKAAELYTKAAELGSPLALYQLSLVSYDGEDWTKVEERMKDYQLRAITIASQAAEQKDPEACLTLGMCLMTTSDPDRGVPYLETVAAGEEPYATMAMIALGDLYRNKNNRDSNALSVDWYEKAINAGSKRAMTLLASHYQVNVGDHNKAVEWYKKAIDAGYKSWYSLAASYIQLKQYENAVDAYRQGIDAGIYACYYGLGNMYYAGGGVERDYIKALENYALYMKNRGSHEGENYIDQNEKRFREYIDKMISSGNVDRDTVIKIMGEGFLK